MPRYVQQEYVRFKAIPLTIQVENYAMICAVMRQYFNLHVQEHGCSGQESGVVLYYKLCDFF